jgi:hypothetical protein
MLWARRARSRSLIAMAVWPMMAAAGMMVVAWPAQAATLQVCRAFDSAMAPAGVLMVPAGSLFRDNGRADDPLAAFGNDRWQLRLVTVSNVVIVALQQCIRVPVRVTGDSSVKSVSAADNRNLIYAGSDTLLDRADESEELLTVTGRVLDQVP